MGETRVYSNIADRKVLDKLVAASAYLDGSVIRLASDDIQVTKDLKLTDLTPCAYSGYAESAAIVWGSAFLDVNNVPTVAGGSVPFIQTGDTTDVAHIAYLVGDPGGTEYLIAAIRLDPPFTFDRAGRGFEVQPLFQIPRGASVGWVTPTSADKDIATAMKAATMPLNGAKILLWKQGTYPDADTAYAAFVATTFSGYALSAAVTWGTAFIDGDGLAKVAPPSVEFVQNAITVTDTAAGWLAVGDPAGTPFPIVSGRYDSPVTFEATGRGLLVQPVWAAGE